MGGHLEGRFVVGVKSAPTLVFDGTGNDYQLIDGLDVTMDLDSEHLGVDFVAEMSFSVVPGTVSFAVTIDAVPDVRNLVMSTPGVATVQKFMGPFLAMPGKGSHRIQLYMVCTLANTVTFTGRNRSMRAITLYAED